jgi:nitrogen regulatory protein PII
MTSISRRRAAAAMGPAARFPKDGTIPMTETAKVALVTVIAASELEERLVKDLKGLGVRGHTRGKVDGSGIHGERVAGLAYASNLRIEMLVSSALAQKILDRIATKYADQAVIAFVHQVQAIPSAQFA